MKIHRGNQSRAQFARTLFLLAITATFQANTCQAAPQLSSKRRHATAFVTPSSSLSSIRQARNELHSKNTPTSLPMTFIDSSSNEILSTLQQSTQLLLTDTTITSLQQPPPPIDESLQIEQLSPTTTLIVFIIGIIPFIWATIEFWRRIAVGASFGTGSDSVVIPSPFDTDSSDSEDDGLISIGEDGNPQSSRGRRTLDRGALGVAYVLFGVAAFSVGIAVASVVMGPSEGMPL